MGTREDVLDAGQALASGEPMARREAAAGLLQLVRKRANLMPVRAALVQALDDPDVQVQRAAGLALLVDSWRFSGLIPTIDALEAMATSDHATEVSVAIWHCDGRFGRRVGIRRLGRSGGDTCVALRRHRAGCPTGAPQ